MNAIEEIGKTIDKKICAENHDMSDIANIARWEEDETKHTAKHTVYDPHKAVGKVVKALEAHDDSDDGCC